MHIFSISALNFRSYDLVEVELNPGITIFIGPNGQGKTNLVEIVDFSANLQSHRSSQNINLIQKNKTFSQTRVGVKDQNRKTWLETKIEEKKPLKIKLNSQLIKKQKDILGLLKTVIFSPNDLYLIKGDPATRRDFLDQTISQTNPNYFELKQNYERVVKQKNMLLKSLPKNNKISTEAKLTLEIWNQKLIDFGSEIILYRINFIDLLKKPFYENYHELAPETKNIELVYETNINLKTKNLEEIKKEFLLALNNRETEELIRSISLVGPHRDDFEIKLNELPAKTHSSQGEAWSLALCLKLASFDLLNQDDKPILILDDVFSVLDEERRKLLISKISVAEQTLITVAVEADIPKNIRGDRYQIVNSRITK